MGSPRQAYWIGLPFPSPGNLLDPGIETLTPVLTGRFFTSEPAGKHKYFNFFKKEYYKVISAMKKNTAQRVDKVSHGLCDAVKECVVLIGWLRKTH